MGENTTALRLMNMYAKLGSVFINMSKFEALLVAQFLFFFFKKKDHVMSHEIF